MGGNQEDVGKQSQEVQGALDAPQGLNSKKVNYNLSNRRQLVNHGQARCLTTYCHRLWQSCKMLTYAADRDGLWNVHPGPTLLCLDDCVGGECNLLSTLFA